MAAPTSVPRDPTKADPRDRRGLDTLSRIVSSLIARGELSQVGPKEWTLAAGAGTIWAIESLLRRASYGMPHVT